MNDALQLAGLLLIPAVTAAVVALALRRWLPGHAARYALPIAIAVGFCAGCFLFPDRLPLVPERHWQWLPYLAVVAAVIGGLSAADSLRWYDGLFLYLVAGIIAAWLLVPHYPDLKQARPWSILFVTVYLAGLSGLLALLPERLRDRLFFVLLTLSAFATAVLVTSEISLRIGTLALRGPIAMLGCQLLPRAFMKNAGPREILALIPLFALLAGGSAFAGAIELPEPRWLLLVAPAAPLMLWLFAGGPLARLPGKTAITAQLAAVLIVPLALVLWLWLQSKPDEWG